MHQGFAMFLSRFTAQFRRRSDARSPRRTILTFECLEGRELPSTLTITPNPLPSAKIGVRYFQTLSASPGTAPYKFKVGTGLPAGIGLFGNVLRGYPGAGGTFHFTITATDSATPTPGTGSQAYTFTVNGPTIKLSPASLPKEPAGLPFHTTISASGGFGPYTFTKTSGTLPAGVTLSSKGVLSGKTSAAGSFAFTVKATDSSGGTGPFSASKSYTLTTLVVPNQVVFLTEPGNAAVNTPLTAAGNPNQAILVEVIDSLGKPFSGTVTLTLQRIATVGGRGNFSTGSTTQVATVTGVATFTNVAVGTRGIYQLKATISSSSPKRTASALSDQFEIALDGRHSPGE
jgi:hypothetical protein